MKRVAPILAIALAFGLVISGLGVKRSEAMPPFAQAAGTNCSLCHTMMPGLNAYGRYILRTFYSGMTYESFHGTNPAWINENLTDRSTGKLDSRNPNHKITYANTSADLVGLAGPKWSYRYEQTLYSNDQSGGGLGNAWIGYNDILGGDGHLRAGKFSRPVPSVFSNNWYRTGFSMPSIGVGNHTYALSGSGFGTEFSYTHRNIAAEVSWNSQSTNLPNAASFSTLPGTQRATAWQIADASPGRPLEIGAYGSIGTYTQNTKPGAIDIFNGTGFYVMRDAQPRTGVPGIAAIYERTSDSNPGLVGKLQRPPGASHSVALQLEEPLFKGGAMLGVRKELMDSLGIIQTGSVVDFGFQVPHLPYLFAYSEAAMGSAYTTATFGRPTWRFGMRWAGPITGPLNKIK
ncbi:MAG: hypothetical protein JO263_00905 [Candidatus Eremiobacteraeota bacterium]|nr:hypothetical protein [Candidatus Eremiobacteraeota bacterium]